MFIKKTRIDEKFWFEKSDLKKETFDLIGFKHLKLQKALYFLYGFYYSKTKTKLFSDHFVAYKHGPVIKKIYNDVKHLNWTHWTHTII